MSKRDLRSDIKVLKGLFETINTDTTTTGSTIDTKDYVNMTMVIAATAYTDGTYTPVVYEGEESDMSDEAAIADTKLIPQSSAEAGCVVDAADEVHTLGLIDNERYVRVKITSASTSSGATLTVLWLGEQEVKGVTQG